MKKRILHISLVTLFLLVDFVAFAQPGDNDGGGGLEGNDPPPAPINGKLLWLGITAVLFAFYSLRKRRKIA